MIPEPQGIVSDNWIIKQQMIFYHLLFNLEPVCIPWQGILAALQLRGQQRAFLYLIHVLFVLRASLSPLFMCCLSSCRHVSTARDTLSFYVALVVASYGQPPRGLQAGASVTLLHQKQLQKFNPDEGKACAGGGAPPLSQAQVPAPFCPLLSAWDPISLRPHIPPSLYPPTRASQSPCTPVAAGPAQTAPPPPIAPSS